MQLAHPHLLDVVLVHAAGDVTEHARGELRHRKHTIRARVVAGQEVLKVI